MFHHTVTLTRELLLPSTIQAPHAVPTASRCHETIYMLVYSLLRKYTDLGVQIYVGCLDTD